MPLENNIPTQLICGKTRGASSIGAASAVSASRSQRRGYFASRSRRL